MREGKPIRRLPLFRGNVVITYALVDEEDYSWLAQWRWRRSSEGYAVRRESTRTIYMHREVLSPGRDLVVDHINRNRLDNRRANLRCVTVGRNNANSRPRGTRSGFRGVYWHPGAGKWVAQISVGGRNRHLGLFVAAEEAARAYDAAALGLYGPSAVTNKRLAKLASSGGAGK